MIIKPVFDWRVLLLLLACASEGGCSSERPEPAPVPEKSAAQEAKTTEATVDASEGTNEEEAVETLDGVMVRLTISEEWPARRLFRPYRHPVLYVTLTLEGGALNECTHWGKLELKSVQDNLGGSSDYVVSRLIIPNKCEDDRTSWSEIGRSDDEANRVDLSFMIDRPTYGATEFATFSGQLQLKSKDRTATVRFDFRNVALGRMGFHRPLPVPYDGFIPSFTFDFSPDGKLLAGGTGVWGEDRVQNGVHVTMFEGGGEVIIWDVGTGKMVRMLPPHKKSINWVKFSADGKTLVACSPWDGTIRFWDTTTWTLQRHLETARPVYPGALCHCGVAIDRSAHLVATIEETEVEVSWSEYLKTYGGRLTLWDVEKEQRRYARQDTFARKMEFSPDASLLAVYEIRPNASYDAKQDRELSISARLSIFRESDFEEVAMIDRGHRDAVNLHWVDNDFIDISDIIGWERLSVPELKSQHRFDWDESQRLCDAIQYRRDGTQLVRSTGGFREVVEIPSGRIIHFAESDNVSEIDTGTFSDDFSMVAMEILDGPILTPVFWE